MKFHSKAPMLKYRHNSLNSCYLSSLESAFDSINQNKAKKFIAICVEESLKSKVGNRIYFANAILKNEKN